MALVPQDTLLLLQTFSPRGNARTDFLQPLKRNFRRDRSFFIKWKRSLYVRQKRQFLGIVNLRRLLQKLALIPSKIVHADAYKNALEIFKRSVFRVLQSFYVTARRHCLKKIGKFRMLFFQERVSKV